MDVRVRWLQIERPTSTTMLELLVCLSVMGVMILAAVRGWHRASQHLDVMEAVSVMTGPKIAMMEYRAVTGIWPTSNERAARSAPEIVRGSRLSAEAIRDGGAVDFTLSDRVNINAGKVITFRAWQGPGVGDVPVAWLCGHARASWLAPASGDRTTLRDDELPSPCRAANR
jgi:type IV pilus assembly protein PilA